VQKINRLSSRTVDTITKPGRHADGQGLYLSIDSAGRRRWTFMSFAGGKQIEIGLGSAKAGGADSVGLADARKAAAAHRERIAKGGPAKLASAAPVAIPTFGECAANYIGAMSDSWRNAKHRAQWVSTLATYAAPIMARPVNEVTDSDVVAILEPIWTAKAETASRVRGRIEAVLDWARVKGHRAGENPARWRGHLEHMLPARQKLQRGHHPAAPYRDVPALYARIAALHTIGGAALCFAMLNASRSGEVRGATWGELGNLDAEAPIWTIPAARMKAGREHVVPLAPQAVALLKAIRPADPKSDDLVFKGPRTGRALSDMTLSAVFRDMNLPWTPHGMRSSFRDWAGDCSDADRDTCEAALAHVVRDATERAYRRGSALEKRRKLMREWADFVVATLPA
jgi:integrase